jgi:metallo-beta-lactamase family protein
VRKNIKKGGVLLIPIFSLEKTQIILSELNFLIENKEIPDVSVFLDSPLAIKITEIYKHSTNLFNEESRKTISSGDDLFRFPKLHFTETRLESEAISNFKNPKIIMAGSGMSTGGRITEHEKRYLGDPKNTILFVGYQSAGSLGRQIEEGLKQVEINKSVVSVRAEIEKIHGYSSHKDMNGLVSFVENSVDTLKKVFVVMGEPKASLFLANRLRDYLGVDAVHPEEGESFDLD